MRSGSNFWLLSPNNRNSNGNANGFFLISNGYLSSSYVYYANGVRPAISLKEGTEVSGGSGTATDPWVIAEPPKTIATATYLQDVEECPSTLTTGQVYSLKDSRDEQSYNVAKLADGKCWMITNLNLAGGTALSADDTDVTSTYISGFTTQGNLTKSGNTIVLPTSSPTGTSVSGYYTDNTMAYVTNSGNNTTTCNSSTPCNSYYSWIAATLGGKQADGSTAQTQNGYNAAASICPKGWRLPTSTTSNASAQTSPNWKTGDWYALATAYGANLESNYYESVATFYNNAGPGTTPNFLLAGYYYNGSFNSGGSGGYYWSSTAYSSTSAYTLYFYSGNVNSALNNTRRRGSSVRCVYGS